MTTTALPTRRLVSGSGVRLAIRGLALSVSLVTVPLVTRYLGPEGYGHFAVVMSIYGLIAMIGNFGLPLLAGRDWPRLKAPETERWLVSFWRTRHFLTVAWWGVGLASVIVAPIDHEIRLGAAVILMGLPFALTGTAATGIFDARLDPLPGALSELAGRVVWVVGVFALVLGLVGGGLLGVLAAVVASQAVFAVVLIAVGTQRQLIRWSRPWPPSRSLLLSALPLAVLPLLGELYARADTLILAFYAPASHVGVYGLEWRIVEILLALVGSVSAFFVPIYVTVGAPVEQSRVYARLIRLLATGTLPVAATVALLAEPILGLLGGKDFLVLVDAPAPWLEPQMGLAMLMAAFSCFSVAMANGPVLIAQGRQRAWLAHLAGFTGANIVLNLFLIPIWSLWGAALSTVVTACLGIVNSTRLVRRGGVEAHLHRELVWPVVVALAAAAGLWAGGLFSWQFQLLAAGLAASSAVFLTPLRADVRWVVEAMARSRGRAV